MTETNYLAQTQLAERWQVAEIKLERWRPTRVTQVLS